METKGKYLGCRFEKDGRTFVIWCCTQINNQEPQYVAVALLDATKPIETVEYNKLLNGKSVYRLNNVDVNSHVFIPESRVMRILNDPSTLKIVDSEVRTKPKKVIKVGTK